MIPAIDMNELKIFRELSEYEHIPIIRRDTEEYLKKLIIKIKPEKILEYGTAMGYSGIILALNSDAEIYSIENDSFSFETAKHNISEMSLTERIHLIKGDAVEETEKLKKSGVTAFNLIFIDAAKSHYKRFMKAAKSVSKKGTYILSDDIWQRGLTMTDPKEVSRKHRTSMMGMKEYLRIITTDPLLKTEILDIGDGLAVSRYIDRI